MEISYFAIIIGAIFVNNVVLAQFLGICPFLGVSSKVETSLGMGAAVTFVMALTALVAWPIQTYILVPLHIEYMQTIVFILVIAALVQMVEIILKKVSPALYQALGIFLPLITTNCAVLGVAILMIQKEFNLLQSVAYSVSTALGFALALVLIFVVFKLVAGGFDAGNGTASHQVPDLLGKTLEEAEALPEVKDIFRIEVLGTKPSDKYEPGQIVEQDPAGGRSRKNNLVIKVYLCAEEDGTLMPNVVGSEFLQAKTELNNLHLDLDIQRAYSPDVPEGQVMQSSPTADEPLNKGDTVVLTVSKGPETKPLTVPNFVTMHIDDAAQQAEALGLTVGEHQYEFSDKPEGTVIGQSIQQGTEVQSGTEIVFTVSKGASSAERVVVFDIPEQYHSDSNMKIEVMQDGSIIHSTYVDGGTASFTYTFHGSAGSTSTIKLYINGTEAVAQEITF